MELTYTEEEVIKERLMEVLGMSGAKAVALLAVINAWEKGAVQREVGRLARAGLRSKWEKEKGDSKE